MPPTVKTMNGMTPLARLGRAVGSLRGLAQGLPPGITRQPIDLVERSGGMVSPEVARALPTPDGGEPQFQLQTDRTEMYDLFTTTIGISQVFIETNKWIQVELVLETAGPVVVSTKSEVVPVLSGKGRALVPNVPYKFILPRGAYLYYGAAAVNRVAVTIQPVPYLEQITAQIQAVTAGLGTGFRAVVANVAKLTGSR